MTQNRIRATTPPYLNSPLRGDLSVTEDGYFSLRLQKLLEDMVLQVNNLTHSSFSAQATNAQLNALVHSLTKQISSLEARISTLERITVEGE